MNVGPKGLPLATPEPSRGDLLPIDDMRWNQGEIGHNEPVYTSQFSEMAKIGPFASTCQSAHIIGHVIKHRDEAHATHSAQLDEALRLHATLTTLDNRLQQDINVNYTGGVHSDSLVDLALCCLGRLTLYNMYACNMAFSQERIPQEGDMQAISLAGIKSIISEPVPVIARIVLEGGENALATTSPLTLQCLYHAGTECKWFVRESPRSDMRVSLQLVMDALTLLANRWKVAGMKIVHLFDFGCSSLTRHKTTDVYLKLLSQA